MSLNQKQPRSLYQLMMAVTFLFTKLTQATLDQVDTTNNTLPFTIDPNRLETHCREDGIAQCRQFLNVSSSVVLRDQLSLNTLMIHQAAVYNPPTHNRTLSGQVRLGGQIYNYQSFGQPYLLTIGLLTASIWTQMYNDLAIQFHCQRGAFPESITIQLAYSYQQQQAQRLPLTCSTPPKSPSPTTLSLTTLPSAMPSLAVESPFPTMRPLTASPSHRPSSLNTQTPSQSSSRQPTVAPFINETTICQDAVVGKTVMATPCTIGETFTCHDFFTVNQNVFFMGGGESSIVPSSAKANQTIGTYQGLCPNQTGTFLVTLNATYVTEASLPSGDECTHEPIPEKKVFSYCKVSGSTRRPTLKTEIPTEMPTIFISTMMPSRSTVQPTFELTVTPSINPTGLPTSDPTLMPSRPTVQPTSELTVTPSINPTGLPTSDPTLMPTFSPLEVETCLFLHDDEDEDDEDEDDDEDDDEGKQDKISKVNISYFPSYCINNQLNLLLNLATINNANIIRIRNLLPNRNVSVNIDNQAFTILPSGSINVLIPIGKDETLPANLQLDCELNDRSPLQVVTFEAERLNIRTDLICRILISILNSQNQTLPSNLKNSSEFLRSSDDTNQFKRIGLIIGLTVATLALLAFVAKCFIKPDCQKKALQAQSKFSTCCLFNKQTLKTRIKTYENEVELNDMDSFVNNNHDQGILLPLLGK